MLQFVLLLGLWLVLSGSFAPMDLLTGAAAALLVSLFSSRFIARRESRLSLRNALRLAEYVLYLLEEVFRSCVSVMGLIWSRREVAPRLVKIHPPLREEASRVLLANSITLTPGTITVGLEGDELLVHALDLPYAEGLEDSGFVQRLSALEGGEA